MRTSGYVGIIAVCLTGSFGLALGTKIVAGDTDVVQAAVGWSLGFGIVGSIAALAYLAFGPRRIAA